MPAARSRAWWNSFIWSPRLWMTRVGRSSSGRRHVESRDLTLRPRDHRGLGVARPLLQVVEPAHLLFRAARDHHAAEDAAELGRRSRPADPDQRLERREQLHLLGRRPRMRARSSSRRTTRRVSRSGCRAAYSIATGPPCAMAMSANRSSPASSHDRLEVGDACFQAVVGDAAVREPMAALVVADDRRDLAEFDEVVAPDRALPVELQVAEPAGVDQQRRTGAVHGVRDADPIGRPREADVLHDIGFERLHADIIEAPAVAAVGQNVAMTKTAVYRPGVCNMRARLRSAASELRIPGGRRRGRFPGCRVRAGLGCAVAAPGCPARVPVGAGIPAGCVSFLRRLRESRALQLRRAGL